ncbi:Transgelin-3 [Mactra antiquata]
MSHRAAKSGFAAEAHAKLAGKYDTAQAEEALCWVSERVQEVGEPALNTSGDQDNLFNMLSDGYILCQLMNALGHKVNLKVVKRQGLAFKKMECINAFLEAASSYGVLKDELFQTVDLYERQNLSQVVIAIAALGRKVKSKGGKGYGVKESERNSRTFTDEQMKAGQNVIGLQMGSNKGASQAGQNFGKPRMIVD